MPERCRTPQNGDTPMHVAAREGHAVAVQKLLAAGATKKQPNQVKGGTSDTGRVVSRGSTFFCVSSAIAFL
jgi:ankyrin repeat protein